MELMEQKKQKVWGLPAVANFTLGGSGAGFYLVFSLHELLAGTVRGQHPGGPEILSPLLVCLGFFALTLEAGRPMRGFYLLGNLQGSWMSAEVLAGAIFVVASIAHWVSPSLIFQIAALCSALCLVVSHGFIVRRARAVIAWNVPLVPLLFMTSALAMGCGLFLILSAFSYITPQVTTLLAIRIPVIADMAAWVVYLFWPQDGNFLKATSFLRRPLPLFFVIGLGQLLPLMMLACLMTADGTCGALGSSSKIFALIGLFILAGGVCQKIGIFFGVDYMRGVVLGTAKE